MAADAGICDFQTYPWINREVGETEPRTKTVAVIYFQRGTGSSALAPRTTTKTCGMKWHRPC